MPEVNAAFPGKALKLFRPAPYKVMYGGRAGAKSWAAARALLILGSQRKLFILCAREIQKSIGESVYKLLCDQVEAMHMGGTYEIKASSILNVKNGTRIVFAGVRNNITSIKSMEAIDICVVEEAEKVSGHSWGVLLPTIRRDPPFGPFGQGSEVWVVFNPELSSDFTYKYWVLEPPAGTVLMKMDWRDNPWFPEFSRKQMEDLKARDYESYLTIWEGQVRRVLQGAIYAKQLEEAQAAGRISPNIVVDRARPIDLSVDLGRADMTSIWFWQQIGMTHHAVDYYGNFGFDWSHYLEEIQNRKYIIGRIFLPHDAKHNRIETKKSIFRQTADAYPGDGRVIVVPVTSNKTNDINETRLLFPRMAFNEKLCADGLHALAHYRYEIDPETREVSPKPLHDWASHAADALACYAMGLRDHQKKGPQMHIPPAPVVHENQGWMQI